jgi:hypothetical protein
LQYLRQRSGAERLDLFEIPYTHFAFGVRRDAKGALTKFKLYVLCYTKIGRARKPHAALDFLKINREKHKRQALQYLLVASNMIWAPVPAVSSIVKLAYKSVIPFSEERRSQNLAEKTATLLPLLTIDCFFCSFVVLQGERDP